MSKSKLPCVKVKLQIAVALPLRYHGATVGCTELSFLGIVGKRFSFFL